MKNGHRIFWKNIVTPSVTFYDRLFCRASPDSIRLLPTKVIVKYDDVTWHHVIILSENETIGSQNSDLILAAIASSGWLEVTPNDLLLTSSFWNPNFKKIKRVQNHHLWKDKKFYFYSKIFQILNFRILKFFTLDKNCQIEGQYSDYEF